MSPQKEQKQVDKSHYEFTSYLTKERMASYWHQIDEALRLNPESILIVGNGDNLVRDILASRVKEVVTFDIAEDLNPDIQGSVTSLSKSLAGKQFDVILCCQVLEHLPYDQFETCLKELYLSSRKSVIISVPQRYYFFEFNVLNTNKKVISLSCLINKKNKPIVFKGEYYWEIGSKGCSKNQIEKDLSKMYTIDKSYYVKELPYHRFYVLAKKSI